MRLMRALTVLQNCEEVPRICRVGTGPLKLSDARLLSPKVIFDRPSCASAFAISRQSQSRRVARLSDPRRGGAKPIKLAAFVVIAELAHRSVVMMSLVAPARSFIALPTKTDRGRRRRFSALGLTLSARYPTYVSRASDRRQAVWFFGYAAHLLQARRPA